MLFQKFQKLLKRMSQIDSKRQEITLNTLEKIIRMINIGSHYISSEVKCLARTLTTCILLSRWGASPQICIEVAKDRQGNFEAHTWVEHQGQVVIGYLPALFRFTPLPAFEGGEL